MLNRYKKVSEEMFASGFGASEEDPPIVKEKIEKKFKYIFEVHDFSSTKAKVVPPYILQPVKMDRKKILLRGYRSILGS